MMQISLWSGGPTLDLADHWQSLQTLPGDPPDAQAFGYKFADGTISLVMVNAIPHDEAMPLDQREVIKGLRGAREVTGGQAGIVDVAVARTRSGIPYVYSLMKIPQEPKGIHYNLTMHLWGEQPVQLLGHFDEGDLTGAREAFAYEIAIRRNMLHEPTAEDPTGGWAHDPFDYSTTGFVMNMSELPDFDSQFPSHPLSMARELLRSIAAS